MMTENYDNADQLLRGSKGDQVMIEAAKAYALLAIVDELRILQESIKNLNRQARIGKR